jgi:hypothetical protein
MLHILLEMCSSCRSIAGSAQLLREVSLAGNDMRGDLARRMVAVTLIGRAAPAEADRIHAVAVWVELEAA